MSDVGLIDTNLLIYAASQTSQFHERSKNFLEETLGSDPFFLSIQNLVEFYSVITSAKQSRKPLEPHQARRKLKRLLESGFYKIIFPLPQTPQTLMTLLSRFRARASEIHDVHLASVMKDNKVDTIYTADTTIFARLGFRAINPL